MKRLAPLLILALTGCVTNEQPRTETQAVARTPCEEAALLLGNRHLDPYQKEALLEKMRNTGCLR
jgi:hypothetical protein